MIVDDLVPWRDVAAPHFDASELLTGLARLDFITRSPCVGTSHPPETESLRLGRTSLCCSLTFDKGAFGETSLGRWCIGFGGRIDGRAGILPRARLIGC
jgi:hypothetical protein